MKDLPKEISFLILLMNAYYTIFTAMHTYCYDGILWNENLHFKILFGLRCEHETLFCAARNVIVTTVRSAFSCVAIRR